MELFQNSKELFGESIDHTSDDSYLAQLRLKKIGFVFQTFNLLATMSAYENVELPMTILGKLSSKERKERTKELLRCKLPVPFSVLKTETVLKFSRFKSLKKVVGLQDRLGHLPSELSGGEQQRV